MYNRSVTKRSNKNVVSVDEAIDVHPGEWLIMEVFTRKDGWPDSGIVNAHAPTQSAIWAEFGRALKDKTDPSHTLYVFEAIHLLKTGDEVREALASLSAVISEPVSWRP
jgi:hypothetical protein